MAQNEKVLVPDMGEVDTVEVVEVLVSVGSQIAVDDSLITLESDKATMDVPSPLAGKVVDIKVKTGDRVESGSLILTLATTQLPPEVPGTSEDASGSEGASVASSAKVPGTSGGASRGASRGEPEAVTPSREPERASSSQGAVLPGAAGFANAYASPAIRRFARILGVDLARVHGSGRKGRILREDVEGFVKKSLSEGAGPGMGQGLPPMPQVDFSKFGEIELQALSRIQKISLENLHRSWLHVPHVTQHDEADITDLETFRKSNAKQALDAGYKLTPVAFLMKAAVAALQKYPRVNSSLDPERENIYVKKYYHLGIAVDTENGLVVPVVRNVDRKGVFELAEELAEVSTAARERKLRPDQIQGASFTITSLGGIGGTAFTPIVNAPEVAILGVSRSAWKPVWNGSEFEPRLMLPLSLSYDHRVVDGALAARFVTYLSAVLSDLRRLVL